MGCTLLDGFPFRGRGYVLVLNGLPLIHLKNFILVHHNYCGVLKVYYNYVNAWNGQTNNLIKSEQDRSSGFEVVVKRAVFTVFVQISLIDPRQLDCNVLWL